MDQIEQAKQPQTNAILDQLQANPKSVPIAPSIDQATKLQDQIQKDSNTQMNQLLMPPVTPSIPSINMPSVPSPRLEKLNLFKQGGN